MSEAENWYKQFQLLSRDYRDLNQRFIASINRHNAEKADLRAALAAAEAKEPTLKDALAVLEKHGFDGEGAGTSEQLSRWRVARIAVLEAALGEIRERHNRVMGIAHPDQETFDIAVSALSNPAVGGGDAPLEVGNAS